jgi:hypothetical protein
MSFFREHFSSLLARYLAVAIPAGSRVVEVLPSRALEDGPALRIHGADALRATTATIPRTCGEGPAHVVVLNGTLHYEPDIQPLLESLHTAITADTRLILISYSALWRPILALASWLGIRRPHPDANWVGPEDVANLLTLARFEMVRFERKILVPIPVPLIGALINRFIAPLPGFNQLCLITIAVARPLAPPADGSPPPSVSVVVPARNEAGNIAAIVERLPAMGPDDELIFVEGNSTDGTWAEIQRVAALHAGTRRIVIAQQEGRGKGDAVRKGFALASREVLMILDADLTVPPEELPRFYRVIADGRGEFVNGSRLVYPMERRAMQFSNLLANKAFALAFSFVLGQRFKDTLCGTKVLRRRHYQEIAANRGYFGDFDPFGDFDLIFGAARLGLKLVEIPVHYKERTYGSTNIQRWRHGLILAWMLFFAARKLKFL